MYTQTESDEPGAQFTNHRWQFSTVEATQKTLDIQIYWTERQMNARDPMRDGLTARDPLKTGIEAWGPPLSITLPDLEELGFVAYTGTGRYRGLCFDIYWRVSIQGSGANVTAKWALCEPGKEPFDAAANPIDVKEAFVAGEEGMVHLSEASHNPFVRTNV